MNMPEDRLPTKIGHVRRVLLIIAGADLDIARQSPRRDVDVMCTKSLLLIFAAIFMTGELSLIAHLVFTDDGNIHFSLIAGATFIALMVAAVDAYMFRGDQLDAGMAELQQAGLQFEEETGNKRRKIASLVVRLALSLSLGILIAIGFGLVILQGEIASEIALADKLMDAPITARIGKQKDDDIQRVTAEVKQQEDHVEALRKQAIGMRNGAVNPAADPAVESEQQKVAQLLAVKQQRETELAASQTDASNELAGVKSKNSTGVAGRGLRRIAAEERVRQAQAALDSAAKALADEQSRLDALQRRMENNAGDRAKQAQMQVPELERDLATENGRLETMRAELSRLTANRDEDVRRAIENAPEYVRHDRGLVTQLQALGRIAARSPEIEAVILLVDLVAMALEGSFLIASMFIHVRTVYSAQLAADHWLRVVRIIEGLTPTLHAFIREALAEAEAEILITEEAVTFKTTDYVDRANDNHPEPGPASNDNFVEERPNYFFDPDHDPPDPPKRPRGRPRKAL